MPRHFAVVLAFMVVSPLAAQQATPVISFDMDVPPNEGSIWTLSQLGQVQGVKAKIVLSEVRLAKDGTVPRFILSSYNPRGTVTLSVGHFIQDVPGLTAVMALEWDDSVKLPDLKPDTARFPGTFAPGDTIAVEMRWSGSGVTAAVNGTARTLRLLDPPTSLSLATLSAEVKATDVSYIGAPRAADSARYDWDLSAPAGRYSEWVYETLGGINGAAMTVSLDSLMPDDQFIPSFTLVLTGAPRANGYRDGQAQIDFESSVVGSPLLSATLRSWALDSTGSRWIKRDSMAVPGTYRAKQKINLSLRWTVAGRVTVTGNGTPVSFQFPGKPARMLLEVWGATVRARSFTLFVR